MNIQKILSIVFIIIAFTACATAKWKKNYINDKGAIIHQKYSIPTDKFFFQTEGNEFVNKPYEKFTRKDVKKYMAGYERIIAQIPDSISINDSVTDSFYTNKIKIIYIITKGLQTSNKHLLE